MKQHRIFMCLYICLLPFSVCVSAQRYLGIATSEWNSINSLFLNPANIACSDEKIAIGIISFNAGVDNNLGTFTSLGNIGSALNSSGSGGKSVFSNSGRSTFSMILPAAEVRGPSVLVKINDKQSLALTTRIRVMNQLNDFDQSLFNTIICTH